MNLYSKSLSLPTPEEALPGRAEAIGTESQHYVNGAPLKGPYPRPHEMAMFGMGCFWGAEKLFWPLEGVLVTAVGYSGGLTPNPTYTEVCSGQTGHTEAVLVVFDPEKISYRDLLRVFWENHDPTQGMRQGNDVGTQYRSGIYVFSEAQRAAAEETGAGFNRSLHDAGYGPVTTEIAEAGPFYFAEGYHQQYLAKNPGGYCGLGGTGVHCPMSKADRADCEG
jgi:peptide-methionine (S)-S-oxide reductase